MTQCPKYSNGTNQFYLLSERICAQSNICVNENEGYWHLPLKHCISYFENNNDSTVIHNSSNLMKDYFDINKQDFFCVIRNPMTKMISEFKYLQNFRISRKVTNDLFGCDNDLLNSWIQIMLTHYKAISSNNKRKYCWIGCHFVPQYDYIYDDDNNQLCQIIHFEYFQSEISTLMDRYNLPNIAMNLQTIHETHNRIAKCQDKNISVYNLTNHTKKIIYDFYRKDFDAFGYTFTG
eukprot:469616_1